MSLWHAAFLAPWIVFALWWLVRARSVSAPVASESLRSRALYGVALRAAVVLMVWPRSLGPRLWPAPLALTIGALALEWSGMAFTLWARETLGALWSGRITLKADHRIIREGPYAITRHPIYTGVLAAFVALVIVRGDVGALAALVLLVAGIARKIVIEERLLEGHFGDEYRAYRREVRAVIPFIL
jgi:protein-S-isoprenylcysteine O-methyltransferase Ste14